MAQLYINRHEQDDSRKLRINFMIINLIILRIKSTKNNSFNCNSNNITKNYSRIERLHIHRPDYTHAN